MYWSYIRPSPYDRVVKKVAAVATRRASPELIKAVLESSLLNKVAYRGVLSGCSLEQSIQFDVILAREYRKRTKNMMTSHEANLFLPVALGGASRGLLTSYRKGSGR